MRWVGGRQRAVVMGAGFLAALGGVWALAGGDETSTSFARSTGDTTTSAPAGAPGPTTTGAPGPTTTAPATTTAPPATPAGGDCPDFPADSHWHARVDDLPIHPNSDAYVAAIGAGDGVKADFGSGLWEGGPIGIPITEVPADQAGVDVTFDYADESDPGPYPVPADAAIEGGPDADGDRHVLLVDRAACRLYELFAAYPNGDGSWRAGSGAIYDLRGYELRPDGWTSADAAGLPIMPGLVRYDEVAAGRIDHAIRVTVPDSQNTYVWPARHAASDSGDSNLPPMGLRLRLRADVDISGLPAQARVVAQAMKEHGVIVADNGSPWFLSGAPDDRWDNDALQALGDLTGADFEAVDATSLMVAPDSAQAAG